MLKWIQMDMKRIWHHTQAEMPSRQNRMSLNYSSLKEHVSDLSFSWVFPGDEQRNHWSILLTLFLHIIHDVCNKLQVQQIIFLSLSVCSLNLSTFNCVDVPSYSSSLFRWLSSIRLISRRTGEGNRTSSSMWGATEERCTGGEINITEQQTETCSSVSNTDTYQRECWRMGWAGQLQPCISALGCLLPCWAHK